MRGLRVRRDGSLAETWQAIAQELLARRAHLARETRETEGRASTSIWMPRRPS
ncbi:MAG: hypothetical protein QM696_03150 [Steroidobacteraceae bacterium]